MSHRNILNFIGWFVRALLLSRAGLAAENLVLRQQLAVWQRSKPKPKLCCQDRWLWVLLSRLWQSWRSVPVLVQPQTVVRWHRTAFRCYWWWRSRQKTGRPQVPVEVRQLVRQMSRDNPLWGAPRIRSELALLGHAVAESTVAKYLVQPKRPPSQTWKTFLRNHVGCLASMDFLVVPTVTFRLLFVFVVLSLDRRRVVHFNSTEHPTAEWVSRQLIQAFPFDTAPRYLIRDRDSIYGALVRGCLKNLGTEEVVAAARSPWQNPYSERLNGTLRRELLDHVIVLNERHVMRLLAKYFEYYHDARRHQALANNAPLPRPVEPPEQGRVLAEPMVGGLHHRYRRVA
jgi:transposase InsO family protein